MTCHSLGGDTDERTDDNPDGRTDPARQRTDTDIAAAAARALAWDAFVPEDKVSVTVSNGWVTLKDEVDWESSPARVRAAASSCSAVTSPVQAAPRRA
ncbi:MAG TPA: BON domain-containing protein [Mycobacteriales bacterium]|nr:BON domain-containing protein [Mycobacteriales bacterium]